MAHYAVAEVGRSRRQPARRARTLYTLTSDHAPAKGVRESDGGRARFGLAEAARTPPTRAARRHKLRSPAVVFRRGPAQGRRPRRILRSDGVLQGRGRSETDWRRGSAHHFCGHGGGGGRECFAAAWRTNRSRRDGRGAAATRRRAARGNRAGPGKTARRRARDGDAPDALGRDASSGYGLRALPRRSTKVVLRDDRGHVFRIVRRNHRCVRRERRAVLWPCGCSADGSRRRAVAAT